ncbi:MAG: Fpg/Nei family DNA glycosylase [Archangium sp.]
MPEGDTILRASKTLHRALSGQVVTKFECEFAQPTAIADQHPLVGATILGVRAVGKHSLMDFSNGFTLRTHMRMNGSWHIYRHGESWQRPEWAKRVLVETAPFVAVGFDVPVIELLPSEKMERHPALTKLGPDLLSDEFSLSSAMERMRAQGARPIGEVLLDQKVSAGIGNVYKSETCFLCGVDPRRPQSTLDDATRELLFTTARKLMKANITIGGEGIVTYTGLRRTTRSENPAGSLWVYGRGGEKCRKCGDEVLFFKEGEAARSTYFCPSCQT